jgi:hypothetical protein
MRRAMVNGSLLTRLGGVEEPAQLDAVLFQPAAVRLLAGDLALDLVVEMIRPSAVSTRNMRPGLKAALDPDLFGRELDDARLAADDASPSVVTRYRQGRRPLRSSVPPISRPSVKTMAAGPSHGSMIEAWYS